MFDFSQLFLYVPGVVIFLVGTGGIRTQLRLNRLGACTEASVVNCTHVVKKDKLGRVTYNYYNVVVEYPNGRQQERQVVKSPTEYFAGQQVKLLRDKKGEMTLVQQEEQSIFSPWVTAIGGMLLILMALAQNQGKEIYAMLLLSLVLAGAGAVLIYTYQKRKGMNLVEVEAEIVDVFKRQISKETKILRDSKFTYYPIVTYTLEGKKNIRRCNINSSQERAFQVGGHMTLYYDAKRRQMMEQHAKLSIFIWGIGLLAVGLLAGVSVISVLI